MAQIFIGLGAIAFGVFSIYAKDMRTDYGINLPPWANVIYGLVMIIIGIGVLIGGM